MSGSYSAGVARFPPGTVAPAQPLCRPTILILPSLFISYVGFYISLTENLRMAGYPTIILPAGRSHDVEKIRATLLNLAAGAEAKQRASERRGLGGGMNRNSTQHTEVAEVAILSFGTSAVFACNALSCLAHHTTSASASAPAFNTPHARNGSGPSSGPRSAYPGLALPQPPPAGLSMADYEKLNTRIKLKRLLFVGAWLLQERTCLKDAMRGLPPFWQYAENDLIRPLNPAQTIFPGYSRREDQVPYHTLLDKGAPSSVLTTKVEHAAYRFHPSSYLIIKNDTCLPARSQSLMASDTRMGSIVTVDRGHVALVDNPQSVFFFVRREIERNP